MSKRRTRSLVPPWSRLLWLGALVFGLLYAHGLRADSSAGHTPPGSVAAVPVGHVHDRIQASFHDHGTDEDSAHVVQDCATGQPPAGFGILPPPVSPLDAEAVLAGTSKAAVTVLPAVGSGPTSAVLRM
ncbi:hypothetical protein RI138_26470 [Streptomyces sp. C11-1]|uniref:Secreted protein n=1 Tax=Streptomyces durocortorensis TaxID=2811104 RepID=A0ABY9W3N9_9ACTN|nr:hypothetical protein [Streptomyces durocortorensis]WNF30089.1 hypothetical protein RI138_26470 [Streptomyces durocortorensis]